MHHSCISTLFELNTKRLQVFITLYWYIWSFMEIFCYLECKKSCRFQIENIQTYLLVVLCFDSSSSNAAFCSSILAFNESRTAFSWSSSALITLRLALSWSNSDWSAVTLALSCSNAFLIELPFAFSASSSFLIYQKRNFNESHTFSIRESS